MDIVDTRPIEPMELTTFGGKTLRFLLSQGGYRRVKQKFGVKNFQQLMEAMQEDLTPLLYEALLDKGDMTEDQLSELLPPSFAYMQKIASELFRVSMPEPRPTLPANPETIQ